MLVDSETELTTAATDALLGVLCIAFAWWLLDAPVPTTWKRNVWVAALSCMAAGSLLGAAVHGLELRDATRDLMWKPLYLSLGLAVALVLVAAVYDGWGDAAARRLLPWALAAGVGFVALSQLLGGAFAIFIVYEATVMLTALGLYTSLAWRGETPGAALLASGIGLSLVAAAVQVSSVSVRLIVRFDHNGLFHLAQIVATVILALGVRASLNDR